jgi:predicted transcriptional regulator of viral defense system
MTAVDFLSELHKIKVPLFQTKEIADILKMPTDRTTQYLEQLRQKNFVEKAAHGKWFIRNSEFDLLQIPEFLIAPEESYISLHSALFYHGMIEQIPTQTYSVTTGRTKTIKTSIGTYSFHHCAVKFFTGFEYKKPYFKLATMEKALVDYFYFSPTKSRQFVMLPELEIPKKFSWKKSYEFVEQIPSARTRALVFNRLREIELRNK